MTDREWLLSGWLLSLNLVQHHCLGLELSDARHDTFRILGKRVLFHVGGPAPTPVV